MTDIVLSNDDFQVLMRSILGIAVALPWKGHGSAVHLELGMLTARGAGHRDHAEGEACIGVERDWRVESGPSVLYGSSNSRPEIEAGIRSLQAATIRSISVSGTVPELVIEFSNGHCMRSMAMLSGDPQWSIRLVDGRWFRAKGGHLCIAEDAAPVAAEETSAFALAESAAARWGIPGSEPRQGSCANCTCFVPLDGDGHFLDYGCCTAEGGPFDGRIVERRSGCPRFTSDEETWPFY